MKMRDESILILYGSETGTAESVANSLWRDARCRHIRARVMAVDDYEDVKQLCHEKLVVFVVATCGQGDSPNNMQRNWRRLLVRSLPADLLQEVSIAVVGLGDSSYDKYNFAAKRLYRRLIQLGAKMMLELALADDRDPLGVDGALGEWSASFWPAVEATGLFPQFNAGAAVPKSHRIYRLTTLKEIPAGTQLFDGSHRSAAANTAADTTVFSKTNPYSAEVVINRELHSPASDRSCRHVEFLLDPAYASTSELQSLDYTPGDHLGVFPANSAATVDKLAGFLEILDLMDTVIEMVDIEDELSRPFPCPCTYRTAFTHYTDICSPVRPHVLGILAEYTSDEMQREKLELFASTTTEESADEYSAFVQRARRSIVDILEQFNACHPPVDLLLEVLPRLQPRFYSISSSLNYERCPGLCRGQSIASVTLLVLNYRIGRRSIRGVCTNYVAEKEVGDRCEIFVRHSDFRLPDDPLRPVILIGPGTGFAPFRGFLYERLWLSEEGNTEVGPGILYIGCRNSDEDFIYSDEISALRARGTIAEVHTAFSRMQDAKIYVQHRLWENRNETWRLIHDQSAHVYVCGDAKNMAKDVREMFVRIFEQVGKLLKEDAENFLRTLEKSKRYQADVWS